MDGLNKVIPILDKVGIFSRWTNVIGVSGFFIMICLTFVDVIMRYIFNSPIRYVSELVEVMMITSIFLAVAHTQNVKAHVSVDVITTRLAPRPRLILESITIVLGLGIFTIIVWQIIDEFPFILGNNVIHTQSFRVSKFPFMNPETGESAVLGIAIDITEQKRTEERMRVLANGDVGIGTQTTDSKLTVMGRIHSLTGGFVFPDGSVQTTAATGSGDGDITAVYADGGLVGGATSGEAHLSVGGGHGIDVNADDIEVITDAGTGFTFRVDVQNSYTTDWLYVLSGVSLYTP